MTSKLGHDLIPGHLSAAATTHEVSTSRKRLEVATAGQLTASLDSIGFAAILETGALVGSAVFEPPFRLLLALVDAGNSPAVIDRVVQSRRVLASVAVRRDLQGRGIGSGLLALSEEHLVRQGVRVVTGYVDDSAGSAQFYRRIGYQLLEPGEGLPPLPPDHSPLGFPDGLCGRFFYTDLQERLIDQFQCSRCGGRLTFARFSTGQGEPFCPSCGPHFDADGNVISTQGAI